MCRKVLIYLNGEYTAMFSDDHVWFHSSCFCCCCCFLQESVGDRFVKKCVNFYLGQDYLAKVFIAIEEPFLDVKVFMH